jgi:DnaD/phage-associated family protein
MRKYKISGPEGPVTFPLSTVFTDKYMADANPTYVMVYIYGLRTCYSVGKEVDNKTIADALGILESDVVKAFRYWESVGIVRINDDIIDFVDLSAGVVPEKPKKTTYKADEISSILSSNKDLRQLITHAETIFGKTLSSSEISTIFNFYDNYHLPFEVILMLLEHCASLQKASIRYAEKIAISWSEQGIDTIEKAKEHLQNFEKREKICRKFKKLLGITGRDLSDAEYAHILQWTESMQMPSELVKLAYEKTIMATGNPSFPYMNGILQSWYRQGIKTSEEVSKDKQPVSLPAKKGKNKFVTYSQTGEYDIEDIERRIIEKMLKD